MIFQISPKLSVARDLPQTYRQTVLTRASSYVQHYYFSTETLISGHKYCDRLQPTPFFHFRLGAKCRQTCTAWVNGKNSYDHCTL